MKGVSDAVVQIVRDRDEDRCARCTEPIRGERGRDWSVHHRRPRGSGGTSLRWVNQPANLVLLCGSGVTGCHGWVEKNRDEARELGFLVRLNGTEPASHVPIDHGLHGRVVLDDYGQKHGTGGGLVSLTIPQRVLERVFDRIEVLDDGCWQSTYSVGSHGYAQLGWWEDGRARMTTAHRVAWTAVYGPIEGDLTVDHMCKHKRCVNPEHLRLLPAWENARRGNRDWPLGVCANGHDNEHMRDTGRGFRNCSVCVLEWKRDWNARRRAKRAKAKAA